MTTTASRIRERREELGYSERELARRLGVSRGMVQQLEAGRPAWPTMKVRVAEALDVAEALLFEQDAPGEPERSADLLPALTAAIDELLDADESPHA